MPALMPKESGKLIAELAQDVSIQESGVKLLAQEILENLKNGNISINGFSQHELHPETSDAKAIDWIFFIDTLNFCFWSPKDSVSKWTVSWNGKQYTGYFALCAAVSRAIKEGIPITDSKYYSRITEAQLEHVLRSDFKESPVPLLKERVKCLHEVGQNLIDKYEGSFANCLKESKNSAQLLLKLILNNFPCFRDEAIYQGYTVSLYKRAQILIGDIWACYQGNGLGYFNDIETIVMFADYRIPQVLIHFGVMKYSDKLLNKLKSDELLETGCSEEVEIRGCSIHAVELVRDQVAQLLLNSGCKDLAINSILIDHYLWDYRRQHAEELEVIPFHKVKGIYY